MPIERWQTRAAPRDEAAEFTRHRRWFNLHALALVASFVLGIAAFVWVSQPFAALAGAALATSSIAAMACGRTLVAAEHWWEEREWFESVRLGIVELCVTIVMLALGLTLAVLGAAGRLELLVPLLDGR